MYNANKDITSFELLVLSPKINSFNGVLMMINSSKILALISALTFAACCFTGCEQAHINPPLSIKMRSSYVHGYVLQITNKASEHVECEVYIIDKEGVQSRTFRRVINSGKTQEFGCLELDGRYIEEGDKIVISTMGYLRRMQVIMNEGGEYTYGFYKESD